MRVLCIGSAMIDIVVLVDSRNVERMTMTNATSSFLLLEQGTKVEASGVSSHCGGGAVNAAMAMRRLGAETRVIVKIGMDQNGERVLQTLDAADIDIAAVARTRELATGQAVMIASHDRNATIFTLRGANGLLNASDVDPALFATADLVYVSGLSNRSADCFPVILRQAKEAQAFVAVNPGIRQITSRTDALIQSLGDVGLVTMNRIEAQALVPTVAARLQGQGRRLRVSQAADPPRLLRTGLSFGGFDIGLGEFLAGFLAVSRAQRVAVSDGTQGAYLADAAGVHYCPVLRVKVQGTAGAGDAFSATLAFMTASGASAERALRAAVINAAGVVTRSDTTSGLLDSEELLAELKHRSGDLPVASWSWMGG
ncbi:MAG: carbohydrate kinase family protein [Aestuariivirgaceae bacterium]